MKEPICGNDIPKLRRLGLATLAALLGVLLTLTVVAAQGIPDFSTSYKSGPASARTDDVVTYTIVAVNTGDPVTDVVLSDPVPPGATFIPGSCTYRRSAGGSGVCDPLPDLWQEDFATGDRITTTLAMRVTAGTMNWTLVNCAYLSWDSSQREMCFTTTVNPGIVYLPVVMRDYRPLPDLQVASLTVEPGAPTAGQPVTITVLVENVGEVAADPFWVDLYDNPDPPPTEANQPWYSLCSGALEDCYGIAWYVDGGLRAGESVTLTSLEGYEEEQTHWVDHFVISGTHDLYAFADSWNWGVWYGAVEERNENLDNRYGPLSIDVAPGAGVETREQEISIPWRPERPQ